MRLIALAFTGVVLSAGACIAGEATKRFFTITAIEPKGGAGISQEPFPSDPLPEGGGYVIRKPDQTGRWEVSVYVWAPSQIVVNEGDEVTLQFVGINGANHPTEIVGLAKPFTLMRGNVHTVRFKAAKPGVYPIICHTHKPSMAAEVVIVPRSRT